MPTVRSSRDRGQLTVDFVVGVAVFVVAVAVVVAVVPGLFEPYDDAETTVVVDRVADDLTGDLLAASPSAPPGVLNESCTVAFFTGSGASGCAFDASDPLTERFGVAGTYRVNVTVAWNETGDEDVETLCGDGGTVSACGTETLAAGPPVPANRRSIGTATRVATVGDRPVLLKVRVWSS